MADTDERRYGAFVRAIEARPADMSPLMFMATMPNRPPEANEWLLRWARDKRPWRRSGTAPSSPGEREQLREDLDRLREAALRSIMYAGGGSRLAAEIALDREIEALRAADEWARSR